MHGFLGARGGGAALDWRQRADGRVEHRFQGAIALLALLIVPAIIIGQTHAAPDLRSAANVVLWITWAALAVDLVFVLFVATRRKAALRAHWLEALVVLAAVPIPASFLPQLRLLRFLRVSQLAAVGVRVVSSERRRAAQARLRNIGLLTGMLVVTASVAVTTVDRTDFPNVWRALWWAIVTATTVGYGDITPHTVAGRLIAVILMLLGIGFLSMLTATIAANFVAKDAEQEHHLSPHERRVVEMLSRIEARLDRVERALEQSDLET